MRYNPIPIRAGIFSGTGAALWTLFEYAMGWHNEHLETGAVTGFVALIFPIAAIVWALHATRQSQSGRLTLKQALMCGLGASAVSGTIGVIFFYAYYTYVNPGFIVAMETGGQDVRIATQLLVVAIGSIGMGLVISAVAGLAMRTRGDLTSRGDASL